jgi:hypothetical protein
LSDVGTRDAMQVMKSKGIEPNKYIYNALMRCYAAGCSLPHLPVETVDLFVEDAWRLLEEVGKANMIDTTILNNFLLIFVTALRTDEIEGLVLPLFGKYGFSKDKYTYEYLLQASKKNQDMPAFLTVWDNLNSQLAQES